MKRLSHYCIAFVFFLANFSCDSRNQQLLIDKEDREIVDRFLRYITIDEEGLYTILGSKPITEFRVPQVQSEHERRTLYNAMPEEFRDKILFLNFNNDTEIRTLWEKWIKIQAKYIGKHFNVILDEKMSVGFLVNIPLVIYILREHYSDFSEVLNAEFDPYVSAWEIGQTNSNFWNTIKKDHYLMGLLFGFGEKNAKFFQWEMDRSISFPFRISSGDLPFVGKKSFARYGKVKNLAIPQFVIYQPTDEFVEKYLHEKSRIIQLYKGKDFAETTISYLRGEAMNQISKKRRNDQLQKRDVIHK